MFYSFIVIDAIKTYCVFTQLLFQTMSFYVGKHVARAVQTKKKLQKKKSTERTNKEKPIKYTRNKHTPKVLKPANTVKWKKEDE